MSPAATFHAQLASIMEVLANTAVAEICELVDSGYAVLQLEISRSRKENEALRRKLRLTELRAARAAALRAAVSGCGTALPHATSRPRVHLLAGHYDSRRSGRAPSALSRLSKQETLRCRDPSPPALESGRDAAALMAPVGETTVVIKVEDDEPWFQAQTEGEHRLSDQPLQIRWRSESSQETFCRVVEGQVTETKASSPLVQQEPADEDDDGGVSSKSWMSGEVTSTSTPGVLNTSQRPETYDCLTYELEGVSHAAHISLGVDPGCSSALDPGGSVSVYSDGSPSAAEQQPAGFHDHQLGVPAPAADEPQAASARVDGWQLQEQGGREDGGGRPYVCSCCGKTLACLKNLKTHMRVHTGEKPFVCPLCGKRFSDSSNLKRHQSVHTGEKRYSCVHCGKRFAQSGSLKVHMSVHTDCKQFKCSHCGKTFISGAHLRRHVAVHGGEKRFAAALS